LNDSLSIIVPVRNAEARLAEQVGHLLDVLPDLTTHFEIVLVDDGSTDHTVELARELARQYPQLRLIRHVEPRGPEAALKTGLAWAQGQTVFVQEDPAAPSSTDLRRLWSLRHDQEVVMARVEPRPGLFDPGLLERLTTWGQALRNLARGHSACGIHMIRRRAATTLAADGIDGNELVVHQIPATEHGRTDRAHQPQNSPRHAAQLLSHLRDLATGE
jgi:polyisoprenyl-phosphate glycosyltransferase